MFKYRNILDGLIAVVGFTISLLALIWFIAFMAVMGGVL